MQLCFSLTHKNKEGRKLVILNFGISERQCYKFVYYSQCHRLSQMFRNRREASDSRRTECLVQ